MPDKETNEQNRVLITDYITAAGKRDYDKLPDYLHEHFEFDGAITLRSANDYINMLKDHSQANDVVVKNDIKAVFVDGNEACAIYEVVTNKPAAPVPFVEWIQIEEGKIASTRVKFDRYSMQQLMLCLHKEKGA